jgi:hypothetical protein
MVLGLLLLVSAATGGEARKCDIRVGELVPSAAIARDIAEVIFRSRQTPEQRSRYVVHVEHGDDTRWVVFQSLRERPRDAEGNITVTAGGGGLGMHIDRCNGAISKVSYQR